MHSTEISEPAESADPASGATLSSRLSGDLFDQVLCPLAAQRRADGASPYFPVWRDEDATSYFSVPDVGQMTAESFDYPGGGDAERLADALTDRWAGEGEEALGATGRRLRAIVGALRDEAVSQDASVDIFCYTLF